MELRLGWDMTLASLLLAFVLSVVVAWVYVATYQGLSYTRTFVESLALGGIIAALVMLAIGEDVARGLGVVGALTMVRFRSTLKDSRDTMFVFASLGLGVACGVQAFALAIGGAAVFSGAALVVAWTGLGTRRRFDAVLRLRLDPASTSVDALGTVLKRHCDAVTLLTLRENGDSTQEHAYQVKLAHPDVQDHLVRDLGALPGVASPTLLMQDQSLEM